MRKSNLILLVILASALPAYAARGRDQSYFTFDDGGTIVKQADDGREVEARVNLPVYPGDEVITNRRGRSEIRLADGNVIALDRSTAIKFQSILDSYDGDSSQTVVELQYGHVAVQRTNVASEILRLDTPNASYAATDEAIYSVEADSHGRDRVTVISGSLEVRTPARTVRVRAGEEAHVDDQGLYGLVSTPSGNADEFERWFTRRSQRYSEASSRYLDSSLAYSDYDLQENGSWTLVSGFGWGWRPRVSVGWRPYYNGRWGYGPGGCLTWISYEPWGWVPYHYGRWAYDPISGWLWLPGYTYSPAWVYWLYGPGYIGWAPAGWYDCYRPYYNWAYRPYSRAGFDFGFGFYGHVRLNEIDLRPWTFVHPNSIVSTRVDQAALTTDAIRQRLLRDPAGSVATVTGTPARFTHSELRDPAAAVSGIARRGLVGGTGREGSGGAADMTAFFRRDPELSNTVRERIVRSRAAEPAQGGGAGAPSGVPTRGGGVGAPSGVPTPGTPGTIEGRVTRDGGGSRTDQLGPIDRSHLYRDPNRRDTEPAQRTPPTTDRGTVRRDREVPVPERGGNWRDRIDRAPSTPSERPSVDRTPANERQQENWRGRSVDRGERDNVQRGDREPPQQRAPVDRGVDLPRRIIDRIGGARITSGETPRDSSPPRDSSHAGERSSPPPPRSSPPPQEHSSPPPPPSHSNEDGGGGRVHRDH